MRTTQYIWLGISVMLGIIWVFLAQSWLFLNIFAGLLVGPGLNLEDYLQTGSSPSFSVLWFSCLVALLIWLFATTTSRPRNGDEVRQKQPGWWLAATILVLLGWLYQLLFTVFIWQVRGQSPTNVSGMNYYPIPPGGWLLLMVFVIIDVVLLFWLPTLLASPRTYRLVVPGAVRLLGGR
jgi:membrane protease YdiL (CAAX protease family)